MSAWPRLLGVMGASVVAAAASAAGATESGFMVVSGGQLGQPDASVIMIDLASVNHTGDVVTAQMAMVVVEPEIGRVPGLSYMLGRERLSCSGRTSQTVHVEVYGESGARLTEFEGQEAPQPINPQTPWADILNRACTNVSLVDAGVTPFATVGQGVAAVRASVDAAKATQSEMAPHRFMPVGFLARDGGHATMAFMDRAQLEHDGAAAVRWVLLAHAQPRQDAAVPATPIAYDLVQLSFNCQARTSRVRIGMSFAANNTLVRSSVELGPWEAVGAATTVEARQLDAACAASDAAPAAGPSFDTVNAAMDYTRAQSAAAATSRIS